VPDRSDPDQPERQRLALLTVEHMDGLRIDRLTMRVLGPDDIPAAEEPPVDREGRDR